MIESSAHLLKPPTQLERPLPPKIKRPLYFYFCLFCLQSQRSHCPWPPRQYPLFYNTFENYNHRVGFPPSSHRTCSDFLHSVHLGAVITPRSHSPSLSRFFLDNLLLRRRDPVAAEASFSLLWRSIGCGAPLRCPGKERRLS